MCVCVVLSEVVPELVGKNKMELYVFDIQRQPVSIHQPLARVLAGITLSLTHRHTDTHLPSSALRVYYRSLSLSLSLSLLKGLLTGASAHNLSLLSLLQISHTVSNNTAKHFIQHLLQYTIYLQYLSSTLSSYKSMLPSTLYIDAHSILTPYLPNMLF